jgi:PKD repeat protein
LRFGTAYSERNYTLQSEPHSDLRGVITWSINWDSNCSSKFEFDNAYYSYFNSLDQKPVVAFSFDKTTVFAGETVKFSDASTNAATWWLWTFVGGSPSVSSLEDPQVIYTSPCSYEVKLTATNSAGIDTKTVAGILLSKNLRSLFHMIIISYQYKLKLVLIKMTVSFLLNLKKIIIIKLYWQVMV